MSDCEHNVIKQKGTFVSAGLSGIVELLPSGLVLKSPWPGFRSDDSRREIANEFEIYRHLGPHQRLVPMEGFTVEGGLLLQYMPLGTLADYLRAHAGSISLNQRLQWVWQASEGLLLLHSKGVIHSDLKTANFLLDDSLSLRIADFSSSSLNGSHMPNCGTTRFRIPQAKGKHATVRADLFGLGSTAYEIMTGESPYEKLGSDEVVRLYKAQDFPKTTGTPCDTFIRNCWSGKFSSSQDANNHIKDLTFIQTSNPNQPSEAASVQNNLHLDG